MSVLYVNMKADLNYEKRYIVLSNYCVYDYESELQRDLFQEDHEWVAINTKDTNRIEIVYDEESYKTKT